MCVVRWCVPLLQAKHGWASPVGCLLQELWQLWPWCADQRAWQRNAPAMMRRMRCQMHCGTGGL
eukprot:7313734-Prorocentrum_lima.AAC.1